MKSLQHTTRWKWIILTVLLVSLIGFFIQEDPDVVALPPAPDVDPSQEAAAIPPALPTAAESLLQGYGDAAVPPIEDLRKMQHVVTGYFSAIKDSSRNPIGGNEDLAAALKGENPNREIFLRADHPVFSADGRLLDRWGTPLIVHPEGWRQLTLRSAGPDKAPYTADDLLLDPRGMRLHAE